MFPRIHGRINCRRLCLRQSNRQGLTLYFSKTCIPHNLLELFNHCLALPCCRNAEYVLYSPLLPFLRSKQRGEVVYDMFVERSEEISKPVLDIIDVARREARFICKCTVPYFGVEEEL